MTPQDQLDLVKQMVARTQKNYSYNGNMFLVWGLATSLIAIIHHFLLNYFSMPQSYWIWFGMVIPGIIYRMQIKKIQQDTVVTFIDKTLKIFWILGGLFMLSLLLLAPTLGWNVVYPIFMMFLGFGSTITGAILKFMPLYYGGILGWILGMTAATIPVEYLLLQLFLVSTCAFTIPGFLLAQQSDVQI